ncbi:sensor histidine kinase [Lutibacter sp.]|uniref:sensor histidine kinase n=1 Tax=Lutibacter sp. TaxID=1925666 RepID=UPI00356428FC
MTQKDTTIQDLLDFENEFKDSLSKSNNFCIALYNLNKNLIFSNVAFQGLIKGDATESLINPTFDKLLTLNPKDSLIFEGVLTIGDSFSINSSIEAKIFRKNDKILILGEISAVDLLEQNTTMHLLNSEINNLQRKLIKEKHLLQQTLKELGKANKELNELNATKDKFFSIIAHDLKSPFNTILGFSELLYSNISNYSPDKTEQFASHIYKSAKNAFGLLENLLTWSSLQTGKLEPRIEQINLTQTIEAIYDLCLPIANSKDIALSLSLDGSSLVLGDEQMINTILRNLVTNSIKYTYPFGKITIKTQNLENEVVVIISDTGIGIDPSKLNKLFSLECELSIKGTNNEEGTGLGLILCKDFVEIQGGKIWVESELDKGSSFKFTLPRVK